MADLLIQYLCCCLPAPRHPQDDPERAPLLNPDILPEAPPRPVGRTTEEQLAEQEQLRKILSLAEERLISIESSTAFRPPTPPSSSHPHTHVPSSSSPDSSSTRPRSRSPWRPPVSTTTDDGPFAPIRVVHLDRQNWTELPSEPSTPAPRKRKGQGKKRVEGRPPSSHSMKTLPRGRGGGVPPSPLRHGASSEDEDGERDEDDDEESKYGTVASYRTATDGSGGSASTIRQGLRDVSWGREDDEPVDPEREAALAQAIDALEQSIDDWTLPPCGPFVAELGDEERGEMQQR
ncbi:hypothetical protein NBRC10512_001340 [Rhodotorula toruloides]|uniref:RHTO0S32e00474g1_1 n=2 Tax=Rhodotorula toruloides TaxID=5286 RepID=A0A061BIB5_RHOTO|nr:uncharacterized protein RHTO_06583 [Rhodotorula toruloides NP11]EMS18211.1 hypothetical protein RHTO_06583 [Rhodotorula toruloides NP11]CDR49769.1 RHTO0S32e00474g1_1 [Rhodotorula toruloides]